MKNKFIWILLIILYSIPAIAALFHSGFFQSDDGEWMVIRFSAFHQALADGQFPVRFLGRLNHGYSYPVANFLYPGFMYLAEPIHLLGFGFVNTIKIILGLSMVGSAIFCFLWLSKFFDKFSSTIGSLFYLYAPYHLYDLYKRGSVGEVLALAIVPFILWQIERKSFFWSSISIGGLILFHNTLAMLFLPAIMVYIVVRYGLSSLLKIYWYIGIFVVGLGLSAFFWIPAFFELQYAVFSQTQVSNWNNYFSEVNLIGTLTFLVLLLTFFFFASSKIKISKHRLATLLLVVGIVSVFFASSLSTPLWQILPVSFVQFPFRFLSLTVVSISFLAACIISVAPNKLKIPISVLFLIILAISAKPFIGPLEFFDKGEGFYATNMGTTTVKDEYMPKWVKEKPTERFVEKVEIVEGVGKVENVSYNSKKITFNVLAKENMKVRVNTIYYPGWKARVNNQNVEISYTNEKGVMELELPQGVHKVVLKFSETPLRLFADLLTVFSFIVLLGSRVSLRRNLSSFRFGG